MKSAFRVLTLCLMVGCAQQSRDSHILSVHAAQRSAKVSEAKSVVVRGYFFCHFEGSSLDPTTDGPSEESLFLLFHSSARRPNESMWETQQFFSGKYVELSGILRRGKFLAWSGNQRDYAYLEVQTIKEATQ